jgi:hypothetical protein
MNDCISGHQLNALQNCENSILMVIRHESFIFISENSTNIFLVLSQSQLDFIFFRTIVLTTIVFYVLCLISNCLSHVSEGSADLLIYAFLHNLGYFWTRCLWNCLVM